MRVVTMEQLLLLFVLLAFSPSNQQNNRVNEGASTSTTELSLHVRCEIGSYAERVVDLMTAQDVEGENLQVMINTRYHELEAFHDEISSLLLMSEFGADPFTDASRRETRLRRFTFDLNYHIFKLLLVTCQEHYHRRTSLSYDSERRGIVLRETIVTSSSNDCICSNYDEFERLSVPMTSLPDIAVPEITHQLDQNGLDAVVYETSQYYIIPMALINRFIKVWLDDQPFAGTEEWHTCLYLLYKRFKRSVQKFLIVRIKSLEEFSNEIHSRIDSSVLANANSNAFAEILSRARSWLSGNIFLGPRDRGPLRADFDATETEALTAFEYDTDSIIGARRYVDLIALFHHLLEFVNEPNLFPIARLISGLNLFLHMTNVFGKHDVTLMSRKNWIKRAPTTAELKKVKTQKMRREMRTQEYWAIKKRYINKRSADDYSYQVESPEKAELGLVPADPSKSQWSEFVADLMMISVVETSTKKAVKSDWSCNFTRLFDDYLSSESRSSHKKKQVDCSESNRFDEFLFSKISISDDWKKCNSSGLNKPWCKAWKQIGKILKKAEEGKWKKFKYVRRRSKSYMENVRILMDWVSTTYEKSKNERMKKNLASIISTAVGAVDLTLCHMSSFVVESLVWENVCRKVFAKPSAKP